MDEEIPAPFDVATLTGYSGTLSPVIFNFLIGSNSNLGLDFVQNAPNWQMILRRQQDYENNYMKQYHLSLNQIDGITATVIVQVRNIFDNPPTISQLTTPCVVNVIIIMQSFNSGNNFQNFVLNRKMKDQTLIRDVFL